MKIPHSSARTLVKIMASRGEAPRGKGPPELVLDPGRYWRGKPLAERSAAGGNNKSNNNNNDDNNNNDNNNNKYNDCYYYHYYYLQ